MAIPSQSKSVIIIPCRMGSQRFPGKAMIKIQGKPLIHWVYSRAQQAKADYVTIASPELEIARYCEVQGLNCYLTTTDHCTGTHRCAEVLFYLSQKMDIGAVVNWQGDEPLANPEDANRLIDSILNRGSEITTLASPITDDQLADPNVAKLVESHGVAHWFSRAPMRGSKAHCGMYAFKPSILDVLSHLKPTHLSSIESLEQLAWLEEGFRVDVLDISQLPLSINAPSDIEKFERVLTLEET